MARRQFKGNTLATTLSGGITAGATSLVVVSGGGSSFPDATVGPFVITLNLSGTTEEKILVGARTGDTFSSLTRGYDGTIAAAHNAGETVRHTISAVDLDEANAHVNLSSNVHGLAGTLVDTSTAQTLTNKTLGTGSVFPATVLDTTSTQTAAGKTLTSPVLNTPTLNGSGGALTLPAGPDTLVGRATTDTLTNKTLTNPVITGYTKTVRIPFTFQVLGALALASGDTNYIPPIFISLPAGQTAVVTKTTQRIHSGASSVSFTVSHGAPDAGTSIGGLTTISATTTAGSSTATSANTLADGDALQVTLTAVNGTPYNLTVTVFVDMTF